MAHRLISGGTSVLASDRITNTTTRSLFGSASFYWAPNNYVGGNSARDLILEAYLQISTKASAPGNLVLDLSWAGAQMCIATFTNIPAGLSNARLKVDATLRIAISNGPPDGTGTIIAGGIALLDNAGNPVSAGMVNVASVGTGGQKAVNTKAAASVGLACTWSLADAANIATLDLARWSELTI